MFSVDAGRYAHVMKERRDETLRWKRRGTKIEMWGADSV